MGIARAATVITPVVLTGTILIGNSPEILTGTWSKPTERVYTLCRDNAAIKGCDKVSLSTIQSYQYQFADIGPTISIKEFALIGSLSSSASATFDHAGYLTGTAIWHISRGLTTQASGTATVANFWASSYGGLSCTLSSSSSVGTKPVYTLTGALDGRPGLIFDGIDDSMYGQISAKGSSYDSQEYAITGYRIAFGTLGNVVIGHYASDTTTLRCGLRDRTASTFYNSIATSTLIFGGTDADPDLNYSRWWGTREGPTSGAGGHGEIVNVTTAAGVANTLPDNEFVAIGGSPGNTICTNIVVEAVDFGVKLDPTRLLHLRALLTYLTNGGNKI